MIGKIENRADEVGLLLSRNVSIEGKMTFAGMARLDGKFQGEILSGDELIVGETAVINAEIKVGTIIINGEVNGNVSTKVKTEIHSTGKLHGKINTPALVIEEGGVFDGMCKMDRGAEAAAKKVTPLKEIEASPPRA
jgi:cytoskeletal protein CcmA (bactofilin family)